MKYDYMYCIFGLAVFFSSYIFNISPRIKIIVASGYIQGRNPKTGDKKNEYVFSNKFTREEFEAINPRYIDILEFWEKFESRYILSQNYDFKPIEPFK
jgi:hypothetical protein